MTGQEMMDIENRVEEIREEMHTRFPDVKWPEPALEPIYHGRLKKVEVKERKAIMNILDGTVWDIVSNDYALIPHEKALYDVLNGLPEEMGTPEVDIQLWKDSARFKANIMFPEVNDKFGMDIKKGDRVRPRLSVVSSYDRGLLHSIEMGAEQVVCTNGLVMFKATGKAKRKHIIGSAMTVERMAVLAENFITEYSISTEQWRKWAEKQISKIEVNELLETLPFSEPERDRILHLPLMSAENKSLLEMSNPTFWDLNSAATQFAKHEVRGMQRSMDLETDIARVMENNFGRS